MTRLTAVLLAGALMAAPVAATAQNHGGGSHGGGGGFRGGGVGPAAVGGGFRGGGFRGGGFRGGYRGFYGPRFGFGFGFAAYDPWFWGGPWGYDYPGYYGAYYAPYQAYGYDDGDYDYAPPPNYRYTGPPVSGSSAGTAPPVGSAPVQQQACGQWVWHADQNKYAWQPGACT